MRGERPTDRFAWVHGSSEGVPRKERRDSAEDKECVSVALNMPGHTVKGLEGEEDMVAAAEEIHFADTSHPRSRTGPAVVVLPQQPVERHPSKQLGLGLLPAYIGVEGRVEAEVDD